MVRILLSFFALNPQTPYYLLSFFALNPQTPLWTYLLESGKMEKSHTDNTNCEREMFQLIRRVTSYIENLANKGIRCEKFATSTGTSGSDGHSRGENDGAVQPHLISCVLFRRFETGNQDILKLEIGEGLG